MSKKFLFSVRALFARRLPVGPAFRLAPDTGVLVGRRGIAATGAGHGYAGQLAAGCGSARNGLLLPQVQLGQHSFIQKQFTVKNGISLFHKNLVFK